MSLLEAYALFGLPFILMSMGLGALLFQRAVKRRQDNQGSRPHINLDWRSH